MEKKKKGGGEGPESPHFIDGGSNGRKKDAQRRALAPAQIKGGLF